MADAAAVVYLFWGPAGTDTLDRFAASWRAHRPGHDARLVILRKELTAEQDARCRSVAGELGAETLEVGGGLDLASYRQAADTLGDGPACFLNSASELLADGWLATLLDALREPSVGLVGATGAYETLLQHVPAPMRLVQSMRLPRFPNPHVRTTGFVIELELMRALHWPIVERKQDAWALENGRRSVSRQVQRHGLALRVAGRDGRSYPPEQWPASATFRAGEQANLLIADNRTREWAQADPARRAELTRTTWGE